MLAQGFTFEGNRVPLVGPPGIFKPAVIPEIPLTITTVPIVEGRQRPYDDGMDDQGLLRYKYRGSDPAHFDNVGLRRAMARHVPLIYLYGVIPGRYIPEWPVFIVGDDPATLSFTVAIDDRRVSLDTDWAVSDPATDGRRAYVTRVTRQRLHQQAFRERVLRAYREQCAICRLHHEELLDAAHILPDSDPRGAPVVSNGLALCKLHHAAFDRYILGIRPDLTVDLRLDILREADGPMLLHGLQGFQGRTLHLPRKTDLRPNLEFIEERYEKFKNAV
jgi:putative restriction endonuclease